MQTQYKHSLKATVSSKGQFVIPKKLRESLGLHAGTEMVIIVKKDGSLELSPVKRTIDMFFGRCKNSPQKSISVEDIDSLIMQTVLEEDTQTKSYKK
jgi:antitoxin PrlF